MTEPNRLRGIVRNAVVWGVGWSAVAAVPFTLLKLVGALGADWTWREGIGLAGRFGIWGMATGAIFALVIPGLYRGRRLDEINWLSFAIRGGIAAAIAIPLLLNLLRLLGGEGLLSLDLVRSNATFGFLFGSVAAGGTIKVAQLAGRSFPRGKEAGAVNDEGETGGQLADGDPLSRLEHPTRESVAR